MLDRLYEIYENSSGICTDTRKITAGSVFFALKGEHFNGNKYAEEALEKGCVCAVVDEKVSDRIEAIQVNNVLETLQELARIHRKKLLIPVIGLTGSNGKTTTKELIRSVLERKYNVFATSGNLNNHIGVPLSILAIRRRHEIAVIEMGANHVGEIADLCDIANPDCGLITNIGKAHLEGFGGIKGVIQAKSELYVHLKNNESLIFYNNDDQLLTELVGNYEPVVKYGSNENCSVVGEFLESNPLIRFKWRSNDTVSSILQTKLIGEYNFQNVMASIAIGMHFTVPVEDISKALCDYEPANNRSQIVSGKNTLILDAYNANPTSMVAALENFVKMEGDKFFILGDMLELGSESEKEHMAIIECLEKLGLVSGILIGERFSRVSTSSDYFTFNSCKEVEPLLSRMNLSGKLVLLKGSRGIRLESLQKFLV